MIPAEARGAWREIEARLRPYVARRVASAADVDDIVQDIFVKMQRGLGELRDGERFGAWVYRIARHVIVDTLRAKARLAVVPDAGVELSDQASPETTLAMDAVDAMDAMDATDAMGDALQSELGQCVALFVARLPSPYREAITLTELQGLTQREAADMLGVSISGMKSRVQRGREKIRAMFDACCRISVDCRGRVVECEARALEEIPEDCRSAAVSWAARRRE